MKGFLPITQDQAEGEVVCHHVTEFSATEALSLPCKPRDIPKSQILSLNHICCISGVVVSKEGARRILLEWLLKAILGIQCGGLLA